MDDLIGAGLLGLAKALQRFDPDRSPSLALFAEHRIQGEMLDELRRLDPISRDARSNVKRLRAVLERRSRRGIEASPDSVAHEMGISVGSLRKIERQAQVAWVPLDSADELVDHRSDPFEQVHRDEVRRRLMAAFERLSQVQRLVITLRYFEEAQLADIAAVLGVTASRVCQIHTAALERLRVELASEASALALAA